MTGILDQLGIDPFYIFLILFIMQVVLIVLLVVLYDIYKRLEKSYTVFMKGKNGKDLEKSIFRKFSKLDKIAELVKENERHVKKLSKQAKSQYQKSEIVRYDALHEMNGNMSFVLTMLDGENSGWIFNAMHSREGCYTYIKEVIKGETYIELSEEEQECLVKTICQEAYDVKKVNKPSKRMRG